MHEMFDYSVVDVIAMVIVFVFANCAFATQKDHKDRVYRSWMIFILLIIWATLFTIKEQIEFIVTEVLLK